MSETALEEADAVGYAMVAAILIRDRRAAVDVIAPYATDPDAVTLIALALADSLATVHEATCEKLGITDVVGVWSRFIKPDDPA